jgi:hypothetical protein
MRRYEGFGGGGGGGNTDETLNFNPGMTNTSL